MNINKMIAIANSSNFDPKFTITTSLSDCAQLINRPHEDYPLRVDKTKEMINFLVEEISITGLISERVISHIQSTIMDDLEDKGSYRKILVHPEGGDKDTYFDPIHIQEAMGVILPIHVDVEIGVEGYNKIIVDWYKAFQTIHPFTDGNGRTGGVVVAALSAFVSNIYLTPTQ